MSSSFGLDLSICAVADLLQLQVLLFQLPLHLKVCSSFHLDALLLHIANDTSMHSLCEVSESAVPHGGASYCLIEFLLAVYKEHNTYGTYCGGC